MKAFENEIVFRGHHDKLADQISDRILMDYLKIDPNARVNVDVVGGEDTIFVTGQVLSNNSIDVESSIREMMKDVGYLEDFQIINEIQLKEPQTSGVCTLHGYACNSNDILLPEGMTFLQDLSKMYDNLCKKNKTFLADGKASMRGLYNDDGKLVKIKSIKINHQNLGSDEEIIMEILSNLSDKYETHIEDISINPYGPYLVGGFKRDTGLTGRKHRIDSYHGFAPSNRIVLSGRDIYGLRGGVYKAREIAKKTLKENDLEWCEVSIEYGNNCEPLLISIDSNMGEIIVEDKLYEECLPSYIVKELDLINKDYVRLSSFGQIQD